MRRRSESFDGLLTDFCSFEECQTFVIGGFEVLFLEVGLVSVRIHVQIMFEGTWEISEMKKLTLLVVMGRVRVYLNFQISGSGNCTKIPGVS